MDEQLFKRSIQSIEMPEEMKDRIIANCRSGEAKPLILPKKRFAYLPTAVTACVCASAVALAGVGVWQMGVLGGTLPLQNGAGSSQSDTNLTLDKLREICSGDPSGLSWSDFEQYEAMDVGSGLYILQYNIEDKYKLLIGGVPEAEPGYMMFSLSGADGDAIDIREGGLEEYIASHPVKESLTLTLDKLREICSGDISTLDWRYFEQFVSTGARSDLLWLQYDIEDKYTLIIGPKDDSYFMYLCVIGAENPDTDDHIDIRDGGLEEFIASHPVKVPLTLDKLREICSGDTSSLSWSDFEQFECTETGSGLLILQYFIDDKYTLCIGGVPGEAWYMQFYTIGQYYAIDIREEDLEEYLNLPIPEGDFINIIPLTDDDIHYSTDIISADWEQELMTDEELSEFYGIDITAFGNIPSYMTAESYTDNGGMRSIWWSSDGTTLCYDRNDFRYSSPDGSAWIEISLGRMMNNFDDLWAIKKLRSRIGDRDLVIGKTEYGHYLAQFRSGRGEICIVVNAYGISEEELHDVIAALVEQTDYEEDLLFDLRIQDIVQYSETIEELYQSLEDLDTDGRIDSIVISYRGEPVTDKEGELKEGMRIEVYYDNGTSVIDCIL